MRALKARKGGFSLNERRKFWSQILSREKQKVMVWKKKNMGEANRYAKGEMYILSWWFPRLRQNGD